MKGATETWAIEHICEDLATIGLQNDRIVAKSDQERAIVDMAHGIARIRSPDFGTGIDNSAVGDSDSNGTIEKAIQDVEGMCRTLKAALEIKLQRKV